MSTRVPDLRSLPPADPAAGVLTFNGVPPRSDTLETLFASSRQVEMALARGSEQLSRLREHMGAAQEHHQRALLELEGEAARLRAELDRARRQTDEVKSVARGKIEASSRERALRAENTAHLERIETLSRELEAAVRDHERTRQETRRQLETAASREEAHKAAAAAQRTKEEQLQGRVTGLEAALAKSADEVALYKNSWTRVLQMERDARAFLQRREEREAKIQTLEARNTEIMGTAKVRIRELEQRLRAAQKELQAERQLVAEEQTNAACALRTADEERARAHEASENLKRARAQLEGHPYEPKPPSNATAPGAGVEITDVTDVREEFERIGFNRERLQKERDILKQQLEEARHEVSKPRPSA